MLIRLAIVASLLCAASAVHAMPHRGLQLFPALDRGVVLSLVSESPTFSIAGRSSSADTEPAGEARGVPRNRLGRSIFGWVLSASLYGMCLTAGMPLLMEENPQRVAATLGRASPFDSRLVIPAWAETLAPGVGVVKVASRGTSFQVTFLPLGPENAAGVSITGCFG